MSTVRQLLLSARRRLEPAAAASLEAELLLLHVLGVKRAWLYANGDASPAEDQALAFRALVERRQNGEPIAYLTGGREFWSLPLKITPDVLIPRPETELLVEVALEHLPENQPRRVVDLGTGSGAVALAIASERPACEVHATDVSEAALKVARDNGDALLSGRVAFHLGSWFEPLQGKFHLIVSNPPYVSLGDPHLEQGDCRFEPRTALTPGPGGLEAIRNIAREAVRHIQPGGTLAFEHGYDQGKECREILEGLGYVDVETRQDLEGRDRVTLGSW